MNASAPAHPGAAALFGPRTAPAATALPGTAPLPSTPLPSTPIPPQRPRPSSARAAAPAAPTTAAPTTAAPTTAAPTTAGQTTAGPLPSPACVVFPALGTTAHLVVADAAALGPAERVLRTELAAVDAACSRFRPDSEISRLHAHAGIPVQVGPLLAEALAVALRAAELTEGIVDPTVGTAVAALGYDRDFAGVAPALPTAPPAARPAPGWWRVVVDQAERTVLLPRRIDLDLGATAKALAADRIARFAAEEAGCGVLVSLGGDVAASGPAPEGGWRIGVGDDHERALAEPDRVVRIGGGGLATSSTTRRTWRRAGRVLHHIVDPRTGDVPQPVWRTVSVAAGSCVDANTASTAAIVLGADAPAWLATRRLPARLVALDGRVTTTPGWPEEG